MTELNPSEKHGASIFQRLALWLALRFSQHEAWALKISRDLPFFSTPALFTMVIVWFFLPVISLTILSILIFSASPHFWEAFFDTYEFWVLFAVMFTCIVVVFLLFQWLWGWFFIGIDLMLGSTRLVQSKEDEVLDRIARLKKSLIAARKNP